MISRILNYFTQLRTMAGKILEHHHSWRLMTSEQDYGKSGPHWGGYRGFKEEICKDCGITRKVMEWQNWKYDLDDAKKRVKYLEDTEPEK